METYMHNPNSYGGKILTDLIEDDQGNYVISKSNTISVINHLIFYLKKKLSQFNVKYSSTSSGVTINITAKYPEMIVEGNLPLVSIYVDSITNMNNGVVGNVIIDDDGQIIYGRRVTYSMIFDIWAKSEMDLDHVMGMIQTILEYAENDNDFVKRGFHECKVRNTLSREFDITDKIVQTVSHLDSSINIRRDQLIVDIATIIRTNIPIYNNDDTIYNPAPSILSMSGTMDDEINNNSLNISNKIKLAIFPFAISSV